MEKKKIEIIILIALLPILIIAVIFAVTSGDNRKQSLTKSPPRDPSSRPALKVGLDRPASSRPQGDTGQTDLSLQIRQKQIEISRRAGRDKQLWRRDPFIPVAVEPEVKPLQKLNFTGSIIGPAGEPLAVINSAAYGVGDVCRGSVVEEIQSESVILRAPDGNRIILKLRGTSP